MKYSLLMQVVLIGAACVIIFTYILPKFEEAKKIQDDIFQYSDAVEKASEYNARLRELLAAKDSFPQEGLKNLEKFIPLEIDEITILHALESILAQKDVSILKLTIEDEASTVSDASVEQAIVYNADGTVVEATDPTVSEGLYSRDFKMMFSSSYQSMKDILSQIEANQALLEVVEFNLKPATVDTEIDVEVENTTAAKGDYVFEITLRAFGLTPSS